MHRTIIIIAALTLAWGNGLAASADGQYQKILAETAATAASETAPQIRKIKEEADSLMQLPASEQNIISAEKTVFGSTPTTANPSLSWKSFTPRSP